MTVTAMAGGTALLLLDFYNESSGILVDPTGVQLDITYGSVVSLVPEYAGPFTYQGQMTVSSTQVYRIGQGLYGLLWQIPVSAAGGVYVANWTCAYGSGSYSAVEDIVVAAAGITPPTTGDVGYWTGQITYGGVTIPLGAEDANGIAWMVTGIDGMDGAPTSGQVVQRGSDHGGWPTAQYYGPRPITLKLHASAPTQALRDVARAALQQAVPINDLGTFVYNEPVPKTLQVRRSGRIPESCTTLFDVDFQVGLIAPDPRKYSTVVQSASASTAVQLLGIAPPWTPPITLPAQPPPGQITVTNNGNFETRPVVTITGPIAGPAIYNSTTGQTVSFSSVALAATDVLVVYLDLKTAYLNGAFRPADISSAWFVCQPGQSVLLLQAAGGAAGSTISASWSDAYM